MVMSMFLSGCTGQQTRRACYPAGSGIISSIEVVTERMTDSYPQQPPVRQRELLLNDTTTITVFGDMALDDVKAVYESCIDQCHPEHPILGIRGDSRAAEVETGIIHGPRHGHGQKYKFRLETGGWRVETGSFIIRWTS